MAVTLVTLAVSRRVRGTASILVVGLMIGYLLAASSSLLVAGADPTGCAVRRRGASAASGASPTPSSKVMAPVLIVGIVVSLLSTKTLNALLLGERYAESMGVAVRRDRLLILLVTSMLAGVVTAFAGPMAFVGVASPHLARPLVADVGPRVLLPASALIGAVMALVADVVAQLPGQAGGAPPQRRHRAARRAGRHLGADPARSRRGDHVSTLEARDLVAGYRHGRRTSIVDRGRVDSRAPPAS